MIILVEFHIAKFDDTGVSSKVEDVQGRKLADGTSRVYVVMARGKPCSIADEDVVQERLEASIALGSVGPNSSVLVEAKDGGNALLPVLDVGVTENSHGVEPVRPFGRCLCVMVGIEDDWDQVVVGCPLGRARMIMARHSLVLTPWR
jgi:hypothetical protein